VAVPLRVLSYNVHGQHDDRTALAAVVRALAPDVVVVQEGPRRFRWRQKTASLADRLGVVVAAGGLPSLGNVLLTSLRVRVGETWCLRYPLTPGRHLRGAVFATCAVPGAAFAVTGTHLATDPVDRPTQAAAWRAAAAAVDLPLIAAADTNDDPGGAAWAVVSKGLIDAAEAAGHADRPTFPAAGATRRIDGVFLDPRIEVTGYEVVDTPEARRASDHLPVLVDVLLPAGPS
jgi:endonuclease/exonuclease/phosphatase family metal-dependent hydrolase